MRQPESRVTLRIGGCDLERVKPVHLSSVTPAEHIPGVQKLLKNLKKQLTNLNLLGEEDPSVGQLSDTMSSPMRSQTGDDDSWTQDGFSTQVSGIDREQETRAAPKHLMNSMNQEMGRPPTTRTAEERRSLTQYLMAMVPTLLQSKLDEGSNRAFFNERPDTSRSVLDSNQDKTSKISIINTDKYSKDVGALGDSEKENDQRITGDTNSGPKTGHSGIKVSTDPRIGDPSADDMFEGMKKVPRHWLEIPKDQRNILDSADSWLTPSLPGSVLQELRQPRHLRQVAEWQTIGSIYPAGSEDGGGILDTDSYENSDEEGEKREAAVKQQLGRREFETLQQNGQRSRTEKGLEKELGETAGPLVGSRAQEADEDSHHSFVDESESIVLESSITESALAMKTAVASAEHEPPKFVQVIASMPINEDDEDEDEELDLAEPSAIGEVTSAGDSNSNMNGLAIQPETSNASQDPVVVEVERTPRFRISRPQVHSYTKGLPTGNSSPNSVVPGTAEEEVSNRLPMTRSLGNVDIESPMQTAELGKQGETDVSKSRRMILSEQASSPITPKFNILQKNLSPEDHEYRQQEAPTIGSSSPAQLHPRDMENALSHSFYSQKERTPEQMSLDRLPLDQNEIKINSRQDHAQRTSVGQRYKVPRPVDAAEVDRRGLAHAASPDSFIREEVRTSLYSEVPNGRGASLKRTSFEAGLNSSSPRAKRRAPDQRFPAIFTPGTQPPVDLEELKRSNRHDFLRGQRIAGQSSMPSYEFSDKTAPQQRPKLHAEGRKGKGTDAIVPLDYDEEEAGDSEDSDTSMLRDQLIQNSPPTSWQQENIYERYRQAYPSFPENMIAFIRAAVYLEWLTPQHLMPMLWDDFVQKFCCEYQNYVVRCSNSIPAIKPLSAIKWYNEHDSFTSHKRILTKDTLQEVFRLDPVETEKARELSQNVQQKPSASSSREQLQELQQSVSTLGVPASQQLTSGSPPLDETGSRPTPSSGKRTLPWSSSSRSGSRVGSSSRGEHLKSAEGSHSIEGSRAETFMRELKDATSQNQSSKEVRVRQASPELGTQHTNMPDPRSIRRVAMKPESDRDRPDAAFSVRSTIRPLYIQSSTPESTKQPRSVDSQSRRDSVIKKGSKRLGSNPEVIAEQTKKWLNDPRRKCRRINVEEDTDD